MSERALAVIPLPLHHYDEAGIVLPPRWLYWMLALACRDVLLVAAFTAIPAESDRLFKLFFPHSDTLWLQVTALLPFLIVVVLISFRERLWAAGRYSWCVVMRPLCYIGIAAQLIMVGSFIARSGWRFDGYLGCVMVMLVGFGYMLNNSHHINVMLADWRKPPASQED